MTLPKSTVYTSRVISTIPAKSPLWWMITNATKSSRSSTPSPSSKMSTTSTKIKSCRTFKSWATFSWSAKKTRQCFSIPLWITWVWVSLLLTRKSSSSFFWTTVNCPFRKLLKQTKIRYKSTERCLIRDSGFIQLQFRTQLERIWSPILVLNSLSSTETRRNSLFMLKSNSLSGYKLKNSLVFM